jgi:hypothetical protein
MSASQTMAKETVSKFVLTTLEGTLVLAKLDINSTVMENVVQVKLQYIILLIENN